METKDLEAFTVFKDNRIIEAAYHLSLVEQRLILSCLSQVFPVYGKNLSEETVFKISADEYSNLFHVKKAAAAHVKKAAALVELRNGVKSLFDRKISTETEGGGFTSIRWISEAKYDPKEGLVWMRFHPGIIPYLSDLNKENCPYGYTKYKLTLVSKMTSPNSIRLYEILVQKVGMGGERTVHIDWLREQLCLSDKYLAFGSFKRFVLDPALKQIKEHSNLDVSVKRTLKHSREIYGYVYDIKYKKGMEPKKQEPKAPKVSKEISNAAGQAPEDTQLPVSTTREQAPQVYKPYSNYGKKTELSTADRLLAKVARDAEMGMTSLSQHFI